MLLLSPNVLRGTTSQQPPVHCRQTALPHCGTFRLIAVRILELKLKARGRPQRDFVAVLVRIQRAELLFLDDSRL